MDRPAPMRGSRSIIFYAWAGLALQAVLVLGVVGFILTGASYQRAAISALQQKVEAMQLANLSARGVFLDSQRAVRGFQATGQTRFLQTFYSDQDSFVLALAQQRRLAWRSVLASISAQARTAAAALAHGDSAVSARANSPVAARLYNLASVSTDQFVRENSRLQQLLSRDSATLAARSELPLGVGIPWTTAVLAAGLMLPITLGAVGLRWVSGPLHRVTNTVRRRAQGEVDVRVTPGGPADIRELATSLNVLADRSDKFQFAERDRARLLEAVREAASSIREHLRADVVISQAAAALKQHLDVDYVWIALVDGDKLNLASSDDQAADAIEEIAPLIPPGSAAWLHDSYRRRVSYHIQDLRTSEGETFPVSIREILLSLGAVSLLLMPFGAGADALGELVLVRTEPSRPWTAAEIQAVEWLAVDVGRGLEHARLYEGEEDLVAELMALDKAKTSFLASASHELRTPLTSIRGFAEILAAGEAGGLAPGQSKMIDAIGRNTRRLLALIEDMLTISDIELGSFQSHLSAVDLAPIIPDVADEFRRSAAERGIAFSLTCPDRGLLVNGDREQLDRVLINLLSNAEKYTPCGGRVSLCCARNGTSAVLTVTDTGIGIPEREMPSVFTRFFRASNAIERATQGSGLGLSIVRTIVSNHHGDIDIESAEGKGTTVTVRIPLAAADPDAGTAEAAEPGAGGDFLVAEGRG